MKKEYLELEDTLKDSKKKVINREEKSFTSNSNKACSATEKMNDVLKSKGIFG